MAHWNYRIVKHDEEFDSYGLHEVYYDDDGYPIGMTKNPVELSATSRERLLQQIETALNDAKNRPLLDESEIPGNDEYDPMEDDVQDWPDEVESSE